MNFADYKSALYKLLKNKECDEDSDYNFKCVLGCFLNSKFSKMETNYLLNRLMKKAIEFGRIKCAKLIHKKRTKMPADLNLTNKICDLLCENNVTEHHLECILFVIEKGYTILFHNWEYYLPQSQESYNLWFELDAHIKASFKNKYLPRTVSYNY